MLKKVDVSLKLPRNQIDKQRLIANLKIGFKFWQGGNLEIQKNRTQFFSLTSSQELVTQLSSGIWSEFDRETTWTYLRLPFA